MSGFKASMMNKRVYKILQKGAMIQEKYYPGQIALSIIVNAPWTFSAVWSIIQGWLSEKTRNQIKIVKTNTLNELLNYCDIDQIPEFLGGENSTPIWHDKGPWDKYEVVEANGPR